MSLSIGIIPDPQASSYWPQIETFLRPAADRGGLTELVGEHEIVWGVADEAGLMAAATARLIDGGETCEVPLVGGRNHGKWLKQLDEAIGRAASEAGALRMRAYGRRGWARVLGWQVLGERDGFTAYQRELRADGQEVENEG